MPLGSARPLWVPSSAWGAWDPDFWLCPVATQAKFSDGWTRVLTLTQAVGCGGPVPCLGDPEFCFPVRP